VLRVYGCVRHRQRERGMLERRSGPALGQLDVISRSLASPPLVGFALELEPLFRFG
jgi:hypothetical protein